jgi:hypothetical protein
LLEESLVVIMDGPFPRPLAKSFFSEPEPRRFWLELRIKWAENIERVNYNPVKKKEPGEAEDVFHVEMAESKVLGYLFSDQPWSHSKLKSPYIINARSLPGYIFTVLQSLISREALPSCCIQSASNKAPRFAPVIHYAF